MRQKVLLFFDSGVDDTIAMIYALLHPRLELVGVVGDYGNMPRNIAIRNAKYVLQLFGRTEVPVFGGADKPMTGSMPQFYPEIHGPQGLGPIKPELPAVAMENFGEAMRLVEQYLGELVIVDIGRPTSLATAFLLYGELLSKVRAVYMMGGAFLVPGNVTPVAEANFQTDPVAARLVLQSAANVTLFPLNVTNKAVVTHKMAELIESKGKAKLVKTLFDFYADFYQKRDPKLQGAPLHDLFPLFAVVHELAFQYITKLVQIEVAPGPTIGQSVADFRSYQENTPDAKNAGSQQRPIRIAMDVEYPAFFKDFMSVMTGKAL